MGAVVSFFSDEGLIKKEEDTFRKPKYYANLDGPRFVLLDYNKVYETRHYERCFWVSTTIRMERGSYEKAMKIALPKLKKYLEADNIPKKYIDVPCPCICKMYLSTAEKDQPDWDGLYEYIFSFVLPKQYSASPPAPNSKELYLQEEASRLFYATTFTGAPDETTWQKKLRNLAETLSNKQENFSTNYFYRAVYNVKQSVSKIQNGHNEVWLAGVAVTDEYTCIKNFDEDDEDDN